MATSAATGAGLAKLRRAIADTLRNQASEGDPLAGTGARCRDSLVRAGEVSAGRAGEAVADLAALDLHRHPHLDLLTRAWTLRDNVTAYDAMYVALAEALDAPIVTCDTPLARTPGHRARIEAIE